MRGYDKPVSSRCTPKAGKPEVVLFVGFPALGKSSFFHQHFKPADYVHINQDTLKSRDKCVKAVDASLAAGQGCVVGKIAGCACRDAHDHADLSSDNTNRDVATRKFYIDVAKKHGARIRCVHSPLWGERGDAW